MIEENPIQIKSPTKNRTS